MRKADVMEGGPRAAVLMSSIDEHGRRSRRSSSGDSGSNDSHRLLLLLSRRARIYILFSSSQAIGGIKGHRDSGSRHSLRVNVRNGLFALFTFLRANFSHLDEGKIK
jgi:hypothetical protein